MYILHWKSDAVHSLLGFQGLTVLTIEVYLAGFRYFKIQANPTCMAPSLHSPCIKQINSAKEPTRVRLAITARHIKGGNQGFTFAKPHQWDNLMLRVACCTGFIGFLRCTEFINSDNTYCNLKIHLSISDLEYVHSDTQPYISYKLKHLKRTNLEF